MFFLLYLQLFLRSYLKNYRLIYRNHHCHHLIQKKKRFSFNYFFLFHWRFIGRLTAIRIWWTWYLFFFFWNCLFSGFLSFLTAFITFSTCVWWSSWSFNSNNFFLLWLFRRITWFRRAANLFFLAYLFRFFLHNCLFSFFYFLFNIFFWNNFRRRWWIWRWRWRWRCFYFFCFFLSY